MKSLAKWIFKAALPESVFLDLKVKRALRGSAEIEVKMLPLLVRTGIFVDAGANLGSWTGPASRSFRQVHAFEPYAELAAALRRTVSSNVVVHDVALSDHDGRARFAVPLLGDGEHLSTRASLEAGANPGFEEVVREVTLARLDTLDLRGIDAIKVDVEGHEEALLKGAWTTIDRERPTLIVEIEERHHAGRSEAIIDSIVARGYSCAFVRAQRMEHFQFGTIGELQPEALIPLPGAKAAAYVNNFIFVPHEREFEFSAMRDFLARQNR